MAITKIFSVALGLTLYVFIFAGCANSPKELGGPDLRPPIFSDDRDGQTTRSLLAEMMVGTFRRRADDADDYITDRRMALPGLGARLGEAGSDWLYLQVNSGADGAVYRQRIIQLKPINETRMEQVTWTLNTPKDFVDLWDKPQLLAQLSRTDIKRSFNPSCHQNWVLQGDIWHGDVDPDRCRINDPRRGGKVAMGLKERLSADRLLQSETRYGSDGTGVRGSQLGEFVTLQRVR